MKQKSDAIAQLAAAHGIHLPDPETSDAPPSSFVQRASTDADAGSGANAEALQFMDAGSQLNLQRFHNAMAGLTERFQQQASMYRKEAALPSSLVQLAEHAKDDPALDDLDKVNEHLKELGARLKTETQQYKEEAEAAVTPSSFVQLAGRVDANADAGSGANAEALQFMDAGSQLNLQ